MTCPACDEELVERRSGLRPVDPEGAGSADGDPGWVSYASAACCYGCTGEVPLGGKAWTCPRGCQLSGSVRELIAAGAAERLKYNK
eukprot:gene7249-23386_t